MPTIYNVGCSWVTDDKQERFDALLRQHVSIVGRVFKKNGWIKNPIYYYIDANAGPGYNPNNGNDGSPMIFLKVMKDIKMPHKGYFVEIDAPNAMDLGIATSEYGDCRVICGNNADIIPEIIKEIPKDAYGLVYTDPNGIPDFDMLAHISRECKKLDLLVRCSATSLKRNGGRLNTRLDIELMKICKEIRIISMPLHSDSFQWTFIFMTNYTEYTPWKQYGFLRTDTEEGLEVFDRLNYTCKELQEIKQSPLFNSPRKEALGRNGGKCELCGKHSSEVHHLRYGGDNTPANMVAVCHKCHAEAHGKDN